MKSISFLSHKGGVGKTSIAINVAVTLAQRGKRVCLLDNDFFGPSIYTFLEPAKDLPWLNEFLLEDLKAEECIQEFSEMLKLPGKLFVGFANPTAEAVQSIIRLDHKSSIKILKHMVQIKKVMSKPPFNCDYLIIDSSPGTGYTTANAMLLTDVSVFVIKISNSDVLGTVEMVAGLYKQLKNKIYVIANQIPEEMIDTEGKREELATLITNRLLADYKKADIAYLGAIPTDKDLQRLEYEETLRLLRDEPSFRIIHALERRDHTFIKTLKELLAQVLGEAV